MSTPSSAGWYENPDNPDELRYFDGILWTTNTTPLRKRPHQGPPVVPPSSGPQPRPEGWGPQPHQQTGHPQPHAERPGHSEIPGQPALASYGLRVVAYLIDTLVVGALSLLFGGWFLFKAFEPIADRLDAAVVNGDLSAISTAFADVRLGYLGAFLAIQLLLFVAYQVLCLLRWSATPGKLTVGISVRRLDRPGLLDADTAIRRAGFQAAAQALGNVPLLAVFGTFLIVADLVWPLADEKNQALHDKVAKTIVVKGKVQR